MHSFGMTDVGKRRKVNQDYLFYSDEPVGCFSNLYIVADGMGGHKAGDKASSYAVTRFIELAKTMEKELPFLSMDKILHQVNDEILKLSMEEEDYQGMGTTFVAATIEEDTAYIVNIGDSRLYFYNGDFKQITLDHSLVEELVRAGELDPSQSKNHPQKNIITRAIGVTQNLVPDFFMLEMEPEDRILLCSDGLSNMVDDERLQEIVSETKSLKAAAKQCIDDALFYGGIDNIAVIIVQYDNGGVENVNAGDNVTE